HSVCEECPAPELWTVRTQWTDGLGWYLSEERSTQRCFVPDWERALCWVTEDKAQAQCQSDETVYRLSDADARRWGKS
ncbi:unnamed protein product, partial [marine sediment metagenome]